MGAAMKSSGQMGGLEYVADHVLVVYFCSIDKTLGCLTGAIFSSFIFFRSRYISCKFCIF